MMDVAEQILWGEAIDSFKANLEGLGFEVEVVIDENTRVALIWGVSDGLAAFVFSLCPYRRNGPYFTCNLLHPRVEDVLHLANALRIEYKKKGWSYDGQAGKGE